MKDFISEHISFVESFNATCPLPSPTIYPTIEGIATGAPENIVTQEDAAKQLANLVSLPLNSHRLTKIYQNTRISTRHLAVDLLSEGAIAFTQQSHTLSRRMAMYTEYAIPLAIEVTEKALYNAYHNNLAQYSSYQTLLDSIGLIVFVSSTGFVAPGIDTHVIEHFKLRRNIARVPINFMGCAAAMNGLRVACDHVKANPNHKALVICLELSSVNAVFQDNLNDVIIHSIFGDGCGALIIGASAENKATAETHTQNKLLILDNFSYLAENTQDGITLGVNDNGITCKLSPDLPKYIESSIDNIIQKFLATHELTKKDIDIWAVHPGGTRIIEKVQAGCGLTDEQVAPSWAVLNEYGNTLSAAVLFVIDRILQKLQQEKTQQTQKPKIGLAFSFSPGVGVEGILFEIH